MKIQVSEVTPQRKTFLHLEDNEMSNEHETFSYFYLISQSITDYFCLQQLFGVSLKTDGRYRKHGDLLRNGFHFHFTPLLFSSNG